MSGSAWVAVASILAIAGCAPQDAGERVGQSLYRASVGTGQAIATVGDRTGQALQSAGSTLRNTVDPAPLQPPPFYAQPGYSAEAPTQPQSPGYYPPAGGAPSNYDPPEHVSQETLGR